MSRFNGKTFIVTGAGTGIGAATAIRLAAEGASVIAADINEAALSATVDAIANSGGTAHGVRFDLGDEASVIALVNAAITKLGRLDGVANVAADVSPETMGADTDIASSCVKLWEHVLRVNLIGTGVVIRESLPHIAAVGGGSIVNVSSAAAWMGEAVRPAYASSKAGLHTLTRHTARAWGPKGVRCNVVAPGMVLSEAALALQPQEYLDGILARMCLRRLGKPEDLAATIAFLLSDDASWVTGQILSVDGGLTLRE